MLDRKGFALLACAALIASTAAYAFDNSTYPDWAGGWIKNGGIQWDPSKPRALGQQAPLTAEYQAIYEANLEDQANGGQGIDPTYTCLPDGMPRAMGTRRSSPLEIVIMPTTTYIIIEYPPMLRRVYTDGRDWPDNVEPSFMGYSIGRWIDADGKGRFDTLLVETRYLKGPRVYEPSGIPLHADNQTIVQERIHLDQSDANVLHDEITTIDHALTRPWTVERTYTRERDPLFTESECAESNQHLRIGSEVYMLGADGSLMPSKKGQPAPDMRYFKPAPK